MLKKYPSFEKCSVNDSSKWFDQECRDAKILYKNALRIFNNSQCETDRLELCRLKQVYKTTVNKKRREFEYQRCKNSENLKRINLLILQKALKCCKTEYSLCNLNY